MTITFPLTPPTEPGFSAVRIVPRATVSISQSPFTAQQQAQEHAGQWFEADLTLPPMKRAAASAWNAFFLSLNGRRGTFLLGDPAAPNPRGTIAGAPVLNGAHAVRATALVLTGLTVGTTLLACDYIQLGTGATARLHNNLSDQTANGSGQMTIDIWPALRTDYSSGAAITFISPKGLFRLAANEMPFDVGLGLMYGVSFGAVEAI